MGNEDDRRYSRAPRLEDLSNLCKYLNDAEAEYILIGGFAIILHGYIRGTMDIDLLVNSSPSNIDRIKKALSNLPDNAASEIVNTDESLADETISMKMKQTIRPKDQQDLSFLKYKLASKNK